MSELVGVSVFSFENLSAVVERRELGGAFEFPHECADLMVSLIGLLPELHNRLVLAEEVLHCLANR